MFTYILMSKKMWSVTFIEYEDDYKHRYDSGVYPESPKLFSSYKNAKDYVNKQLRERMDEYFCDHETELDTIDKSLRNMFTEDKYGNLCIKKGDSIDLKKIYEATMKGEFIPYKFTYELNEIEVD